MGIFIVFMCMVLVAWSVLVAPAALDLGRLIGLPTGANLAGWLVASLMGHDDVAEGISPTSSWVLTKTTARASTGWHAGMTWAAANPATVLAGAAGAVLGVLAPAHLAELGAIVLVRGLPGSGKSTWAADRAADRRLQGLQVQVVSADDYFYTPLGGGRVEYLFDSSKLPQAHAQCLDSARRGHEAGETVYVANTFTQNWEMAPYLDLDPDAVVVVCPPVPGRLGVHGVPQETWDRMAARWEECFRESTLTPRGVPLLCGYCGFLTADVNWSTCDACGYHASRVYPWTGPKEYWRYNGQASVGLGQCDTPEELEKALRASQGTGDWRGWTCA